MSEPSEQQWQSVIFLLSLCFLFVLPNAERKSPDIISSLPIPLFSSFSFSFMYLKFLLLGAFLFMIASP